MKLAICFVLSTLAAFGSTIFGASTTTSVGSTYTVTVTANDTTGADMAGMILTANYSTGGSLTCTWTSAGTCSSGSGGFSVSYPSTDSTHPITNNSNWVITNSRTGFTMTSLTVDGIPGLIAFDRCMSGSNTFDDQNGTGGLACFGSQGTTNSNIGFSVGSGNSSANGGAGTSGITGTVQYQNELHLASTAAVADLWGQFVISFGGTAFTSGSTFTFRTDSDSLGTATADLSPVPEPGTLGLTGAALVLIGLRFKKRK